MLGHCCGEGMSPASGGYVLVWCSVFSLQRLLLLGTAGTSPLAVVVVHGLSCPSTCKIFSDQRWNTCLLHWRILYWATGEAWTSFTYNHIILGSDQSELCVLYLWFLYMSRCLLTEIHHLEENTAEKLQACNGNKRGGKMGQNANKLISHWEAWDSCLNRLETVSHRSAALRVFLQTALLLPVSQFSRRSQVAHLSCVACLPRFSTEWSCNCTEMRPTKFQRSNDNENDHKCLFIYWQARGNNSSGFVWRSQGVEIRLLDLNPVRMKDEPPLMSAHDKSFLYSGYESHPQWSEIFLSKR